MNILQNFLTVRYSILFFLFLIFVIGINNENIKANVVGINFATGGIQTFNESNWTPVTPSYPLTMSGYTNISGRDVTWNSNDGFFYLIIRDLTGQKSYLAKVDPNTGVCNKIGEMGGNGYYASLTFSSPANLFYTLKNSDTAFAEVNLFTVNPVNGSAQYLSGPYPTNNFNEETGIIAYNYSDGYLYHWQNGNEFPVFNPTVIEKINLTNFTATQTYSGYSYGQISGIVYKGGGIFVATEASYGNPSRGVELNSTGGIFNEINASALSGLGYVDPLLPVELNSFTSSVYHNNVDLKWSTSSETNNSGFDIERAINTIDNGQLTIDNWTRIGNVAGNGTSSTGHNYSFSDRNLASGNYSYRLKQIDFNGNFEYFNLSNEVIIGVPNEFSLSQNYPNPFNPTTNLEFGISELGFVSLKVYNASGKEVANLVNEVKPAGYYSISFNGANLTSGIYFYTLEASNFSVTKKMLLVK